MTSSKSSKLKIELRPIERNILNINLCAFIFHKKVVSKEKMFLSLKH